MPQIIPIKDLKNTSAISKMCHSADEPIYVTKNGYGDMVIMKQTKYYEGAGIAKIADDIELRIQAMEEAGYEDVAQIHKERREKFARSGNAYAFSQEWIDDFNRAQEATMKYMERKEAFGKIFNGYF